MMVETYGGRGAEGAEGGSFTPQVSEIVYWINLREHHFWDMRIGR